MKIFLVGDFPADDKTYGGVEGVLVNLAHGLIERPEIEVVLVSIAKDSQFNIFKGKSKTYKIDFRSSFIKAKNKFNEIVDTERPDIIHIQGVVPGVLLFRKGYRNIFVVTQHAILSEERLWQVSLKRKLLFNLKQLIENYYLKRIKNIIFISEYNRKIYLEKASKNRVLNSALIPNPVNELFFQTHFDIELSKSNELYFVGEVKKRKGLHVLLKAIYILKQNNISCRLHVIGGFKEKPYEAKVKKMIASLDISENIVFCGWKNQKEIVEYSYNIPVFVLPSFQETLPLSIAEAMSQGKIVIATNICGIPEMIEDGVSGYLFSKGNAPELAHVLEKAFEDDDRQKRIAKNALSMSKKYHPKNVLDKTLDFYNNVMTKNSD
ncbi:glycosyltransferase family 4 protein [Pareuzebyella sediminis]|uniref:glycosyltransferase family 4 protein n=1 Tax=Pareuzebyella sediminis TaxID=2607998 RepID=UPI0011ED4A00|nr:glycosyltransferase family 4 protein [Pareuzebyella sediminis]